MSVRPTANSGMHYPQDSPMVFGDMAAVGAPAGRNFAGNNYQYAQAAAPHPLTGLGRPGFAGSGQPHANAGRMNHEIHTLAHQSAARQMQHQNEQAHLLAVAMTAAGDATHMNQQAMVIMHETEGAVKHVMQEMMNAHEKSLTALRLLTRHKDLTRRVGDPVHMDRHHVMHDAAVVALVYNTIVSNGQDDSHQGAITTAHVAEAAASLAARGLTMAQVKSQSKKIVQTSHTVGASLDPMIDAIYKYCGKTHMGAGAETAGLIGSISVNLAICSAMATVCTASMKQAIGELPSNAHADQHGGHPHMNPHGYGAAM